MVHLKHFDTVSKKLGEFSDDENTATHTEPPKKEKTTMTEILGMLFKNLFPASLVVILYLMCNESKCTWGSLPDWGKIFSFSYFFHLQSFLGYLAVAVLVAVLSTLPFGGKKVPSLPSKQPKFTYVINGLFILHVILILMISSEYYGFRINKFIAENVFHLAVSSVLFALIISIVLYVRSFFVPISALSPYVDDSSFLSGFVIGREVNPRFGNVLDFKIYILRMYALSTVSLIIFMKIFEKNFDTRQFCLLAELNNTILLINKKKNN